MGKKKQNKFILCALITELLSLTDIGAKEIESIVSNSYNSSQSSLPNVESMSFEEKLELIRKAKVDLNKTLDNLEKIREALQKKNELLKKLEENTSNKS